MVSVTTFLTLLVLVVNIYYSFHNLHIRFCFNGFQIGLIKEMWVFTFFIFVNQIIDQINWSVDKFLLGRFAGTTAVAIYGVGGQINSMYIEFGMSVGFYTSQITIGSFLFSAAVIGWILKKSDEQVGSTRWLGRIGDCSYGIFYVHMAVLTMVGKFIQNGDWYLYWSVRFTMTSIISFAIVLAGQKILKSQKKLLRFIGFT